MAPAIDSTTSRISRLAEKRSFEELLVRRLLSGGSCDFDVTRAHKCGDATVVRVGRLLKYAL